MREIWLVDFALGEVYDSGQRLKRAEAEYLRDTWDVSKKQTAVLLCPIGDKSNFVAALGAAVLAALHTAIEAIGQKEQSTDTAGER